EAFDFTRYAVMKHLKVLEDAEVIVPRRNGKKKELYLNAIPIQIIYDRWISQYSARWASQLTSLKYELEKEDSMSTPKPQQLYVLYIRTSPDELWDAITNPEMTAMYFHETEVRSDFQVGSTIDYLMKHESGDKKSAVTGEVLEIEPKKRLVHTFKFTGNEDPPSVVSYDIEAMEDITKLTVTHDFASETDTYKGTQQGWPRIFSGLKTLLETGRPLPIDFSH
ncbi:MAG: SRPBCC domain-containing protein, partial [Candidatus Krumholzibacteria bacterium]|nr:SRPBCC domain-containing protein [Candidatus Krumholzibacteria bacterium]